MPKVPRWKSHGINGNFGIFGTFGTFGTSGNPLGMDTSRQEAVLAHKFVNETNIIAVMY